MTNHLTKNALGRIIYELVLNLQLHLKSFAFLSLITFNFLMKHTELNTNNELSILIQKTIFNYL